MSSMSCAEVRELAAGYVLGALDPAEDAAVRAHLKACPEPHPEFAELGGVVPYLAASIEPVEPADTLRARILDAVQAQRPAPVPRPSTTRGRRRLADVFATGWSRALLGGAALAIVVLVGATAYFGQRLGETRAYADVLARATALAAAPGSRAVTITAAPGAGAGEVHGVAVLARDGRGVVVMADGLAQTRGPEVYEIWYVIGTTAPVPAGSFRVDADGRGWIDSLDGVPGGAVTLAVTREPGPGATTPTLPILASGSTGG